MEIKRPFSGAEWLKTPETVRLYIEMLEKSLLHLSSVVAELQGRTDNLEKQVSRNSQNSNQPPSADGHFKRSKRDVKKKTRKCGGQKGHPGHRQQLLQPKEVVDLIPERFTCDVGDSNWLKNSMSICKSSFRNRFGYHPLSVAQGLSQPVRESRIGGT